MDFQEYSGHRQTLLAKAPHLLDAGETRIVHALGALRTPTASLTLPERAHRCHLAEFWLDYFGLDRSLKPRTLISKGVRHSLSLLFWHWAAEGMRVLIPQDVYPAYANLAEAENVSFETYTSWPLSDIRCIDASTFPDVDVILIANPIKPHAGRMMFWDVAYLRAWLRLDPKRRVVIDAVYALTGPLDNQMLEMLATGQVIVLHSLSKSWVQPLVMGVALVPEADVEALTPVFRAESPTPENLQLAQALLTQDTAFPSKLESELVRRRLTLEKACAALGFRLRVTDRVPSYLFAINWSFEFLLREYGVLAIPATAFGSKHRDWCVVSSLAMPG